MIMLILNKYHFYFITFNYVFFIFKGGLSLKINQQQRTYAYVLQSHKLPVKQCPFGIYRQLNPNI